MDELEKLTEEAVRANEEGRHEDCLALHVKRADWLAAHGEPGRAARLRRWIAWMKKLLAPRSKEGP